MSIESVGTSLLALGGLRLITSGDGLLAERLLQRRPSPPASGPGGPDSDGRRPG